MKRTDEEMQAALSKHVDLVWYGRSPSAEVLREEGTPLKIIAGAVASQTTVRAKYPEDVAELDSDDFAKAQFAHGMNSGKLSALRWLYGEDWDQLDT